MIFRNLHLALRSLRKNKATTCLNILGLAIGVTVCLFIGIWLQRELSFDNFHPKGKSIFRLANTFKSESESFSQAGSGPAFFGFKLLKGRPKQVLRSSDQIVITERLAIKYFGSNSEAIGKLIEVDGQFLFTISGVAENPPINSQIQFDVLFPYSFLRSTIIKQNNFDVDNQWVGGWAYVYVQLREQEMWMEIENQINTTAAKFSEKEWRENKMSYHYFLQPLKDIHLTSNLRYDFENNGSISRVEIISIVGFIVLLLACINYINMTTAGALQRAKQTSVRKVLGATKLQLIRHFFAETFLICTIAVIIGVVLLKLLLPVFSQWIGQQYDFIITGENIAIILAFILIISFAAGFYPAFVLSSFKPTKGLKGQLYSDATGNFIRKGLVTFQFSITITLVASVIIISQQMRFIKNKSLGYEGNSVVSVKFFAYPTARNQYTFLRNQLMQSPYILNVTQHNGNVVGGLNNGWTITENLDGKEISTSLYNIEVDSTFSDVYNMQLAAGRFFSSDHPTDTAKAVLVNEAAVKTFGWKAENAIGKRFGRGNSARYVIGVIKNFHFESLHKPVDALLIEYSGSGDHLSMKIKVEHAEEAIHHMRKIWKTTFSGLPFEYTFVEESISMQYGNEQKMQEIFYLLSGLSLLIASLGLFGLSIFVMERKVKEIGIQKVLGASILDIVALLSKDFLKLVIVAALIASPLAFYFMHEWLQDFAYRIQIKWWRLALAGMLAFIIALATTSFHAVKAAIENPVKSLRSE